MARKQPLFLLSGTDQLLLALPKSSQKARPPSREDSTWGGVLGPVPFARAQVVQPNNRATNRPLRGSSPSGAMVARHDYFFEIARKLLVTQTWPPGSFQRAENSQGPPERQH